MYVYNEYWQSDKSMLLYPSTRTSFEATDFKAFDALNGKDSHHACGLGKVSVFDADGLRMNEGIGEEILGWFAG
jgi:5-methylcytosine-specific restriction enzyme subunit McrC